MDVFKKQIYRVPVFSWCPDLEPEARTQVDNLAQLPFAFDHIAVMADAHKGHPIPPSWDLAFFEKGDPAFDLYLAEMQYAVDFALQNRQVMADQVEVSILEAIAPVKFHEPINIAHNYASLEDVGGRKLYVHRKGATSARERQIGIIPGSQGSSSYIVEGLGNADSFTSCSHGAGRRMGRNQAKRNLNLEDEIQRLDDLGVVHSIRHEKDLDEATGAYKDIEVVMENQKDLVKVLTKLTPLGVVKG